MNGNRNQRSNRGQFDKKFESSWISQKDGFNNDTIIFAEKFGEYLAKNQLTTSQIRNIYGEVKRIEGKSSSEAKKDFLMLRPKMAYASKRAGGRGIEAFKDVMDLAHLAVLENEDFEDNFKNFCDFFEAVLAYHKAYGGRD